MNILLKTIIIMLLFVSSVFCGDILKDPVVKQLDVITTSIELIDFGIINLNINISIITESSSKIYKSNNFKTFVTDVELAISGKVVDIILKKHKISNEDLHKLKYEIENNISAIINKKQKQYFKSQDISLDFKITNFYFTSINTQIINNKSRNRWY